MSRSIAQVWNKFDGATGKVVKYIRCYRLSDVRGKL